MGSKVVPIEMSTSHSLSTSVVYTGHRPILDRLATIQNAADDRRRARYMPITQYSIVDQLTYSR